MKGIEKGDPVLLRRGKTGRRGKEAIQQEVLIKRGGKGAMAILLLQPAGREKRRGETGCKRSAKEKWGEKQRYLLLPSPPAEERSE